MSRWRAENVERNAKIKSDWNLKNKPKIRARRRVYEKEFKRANPQFRVICNMRRRLHDVLKGKKPKKTLELLGCSQEFFKSYIESKFISGMTWDNYGKWHLDHIVPLSKVDLSDLKQLEKVCHHTNFQPLWAADNLKKAAKIL